MFNLSPETQVKKTIYKNKIYREYKDQLKGKKKEKFDSEIKTITITNELSEYTLGLPKTERISSIFLIKIDLKTYDYTDENISLITKLFGQNIIYVLSYKDQFKLGVYKDALITGPWKSADQIDLKIQGKNLEEVWENLIIQIGKIELRKDNNLDQQIVEDREKEKLEKLIKLTKKKLGKEVQAKKKHDLFKELRQYQKELEKYNG